MTTNKTQLARRRRLMMLSGVMLAVCAGALAFAATTQPAGEQPQAPQRAILIAARDIPARSVLSPNDFTIRQLNEDPSLNEALISADDIDGQVSAVAIMAGQVIYPNLLVSTRSGAEFSLVGPGEQLFADSPHWRAVSVQVPKERAVAGRILAGQRVDLLATVQIDVLVQNAAGEWVPGPTTEGHVSGKATKITFEAVEVLDAVPDEGLYVLKVTPKQATQIYHITAVAPFSFSLALRADGDYRMPAALEHGETNDRIIVHFGFPMPELIPLSGGGAGAAPPAPSADPAAPETPAEPAQPGSPQAGTSPAPGLAEPSPAATPSATDKPSGHVSVRQP